MTLITAINIATKEDVKVLIKNTTKNIQLLKKCHFVDSINNKLPTNIDFEKLEVRYYITDEVVKQYIIANKLIIKN